MNNIFIRFYLKTIHSCEYLMLTGPLKHHPLSSLTQRSSRLEESSCHSLRSLQTGHWPLQDPKQVGVSHLLICVIRKRKPEIDSLLWRLCPHSVFIDDFLASGRGEGDQFPQLEFEQLPFSHPLFIMYSSGTTGAPKCMVHSAGVRNAPLFWKRQFPYAVTAWLMGHVCPHKTFDRKALDCCCDAAASLASQSPICDWTPLGWHTCASQCSSHTTALKRSQPCKKKLMLCT